MKFSFEISDSKLVSMLNEARLEGERKLTVSDLQEDESYLTAVVSTLARETIVDYYDELKDDGKLFSTILTRQRQTLY